MCWFRTAGFGLQEADFEKYRVGNLTCNLPIDKLLHGNEHQSTRDVLDIRVERIANDFISKPYTGKDTPLVCVHPEDADSFDVNNPEKSRFIIVGHNHLVAGLKKAREHHNSDTAVRKHLSVVECKLYKGLSDSQMKGFGALHNKVQGLHDSMTAKELLVSFNRSSESCGLRAIRLSENDNPKSNTHQQQLKKVCYAEAGLDGANMSTHLYLWDLATRFDQDTFDLLIAVMEMYEKSDCKGQIKKTQGAAKALVKVSTGKKKKQKLAAFQPNLPDARITANSSTLVEVHERAPVVPELSKMQLQFVHECCKHSEKAIAKTLSKVGSYTLIGSW